MKTIGIIDSDLLDNGTRFPNLALMKLSGYNKSIGNEVKLLENYNNLNEYDHIYISKVFTKTQIPINIESTNITYGGTGFLQTQDLEYNIEHHMPDYELYSNYVQKKLNSDTPVSEFNAYRNYSIGFSTRGCFRKCSFCVNKKYDRVERHSKIKEFYNSNKKYIFLCDDNILAYNKWNEVLDELEEIDVPFQFKQGMDIRLMTEEKAKRLSKMKYHKDFIFAFDNIKDRELIENKLKLWRTHTDTYTKLYVLVAFDSQDIYDIENTFERIKILMNYRCSPYIMRYESYEHSEMRGMYINLAGWCNQPSIFKRMTFREYCLKKNGEFGAAHRYMLEFEKKYPETAKKYFDIRW